MKLINNIIRLNYALSEWFAKTKDKIVPGTAYLFLSQLSFLCVSLFLIIETILPFEISAEVFAIIGAALVGLIMYGFQGRVEKYVRSLNYSKVYSSITVITKRKIRALGLFLLIFNYTLIFIIIILLL